MFDKNFIVKVCKHNKYAYLYIIKQQQLKHTTMKLYHATTIENVESIEKYGIEANLSEKISNNDRLNQSAVYGFDNMQDAIDFMVWDNNTSDWAIFEFDSENVVLDPEYEGNAWAVITNEPIQAFLVKTSENK